MTRELLINTQFINMVEEGIRTLNEYEGLTRDLKNHIDRLKNYKINIIESKSLDQMNQGKQHFNDVIKEVTDAIASSKEIIEAVSLAFNAFEIANAATPVGLALAILNFAINILGLLNKETEERENELEAFRNEIEMVRDSYKIVCDGAVSSMRQSNAEMAAAQIQLDEIKKLMDEGNHGAELDAAVENLQRLLPEAKEHISKMNDTWDIKFDEIEKEIQKIQEEAVVDAAEIALEGSENQAASLKEIMNQSIQELDDYVKQNGQLFDFVDDINKQISDLQDDLDNFGYTQEEIDAGRIKSEDYGSISLIMQGMENLRQIRDAQLAEFHFLEDKAWEAKQNYGYAAGEVKHKRAELQILNAEASKNVAEIEGEVSSQVTQDLMQNAEQFQEEFRKIQTAWLLLNGDGEDAYVKAATYLESPELDSKEDVRSYIEEMLKDFLIDFADEQSETLYDSVNRNEEGFVEGEGDIYAKYAELLSSALGESPEALQEILNQIMSGEFVFNLTITPDREVVLKDWNYRKNAEGTNFWKGGYTVINERGKELIQLPGGQFYYPIGRPGRPMVEICPVKRVKPRILIDNLSVRNEQDLQNLGVILRRKLRRQRKQAI